MSVSSKKPAERIEDVTEETEHLALSFILAKRNEKLDISRSS